MGRKLLIATLLAAGLASTSASADPDGWGRYGGGAWNGGGWNQGRWDSGGWEDGGWRHAMGGWGGPYDGHRRYGGGYGYRSCYTVNQPITDGWGNIVGYQPAQICN